MDDKTLVREMKGLMVRLDEADRVANQMARDLKGLTKTISKTRAKAHDIIKTWETDKFSPRFPSRAFDQFRKPEGSAS